jgi:hypothetical protein
MRTFIAGLASALALLATPATPATAAVVLDATGVTTDDSFFLEFRAKNRQFYLLETSFGEDPTGAELGYERRWTRYRYRGEVLLDANDASESGFRSLGRLDGAHFKVFGTKNKRVQDGVTTYYFNDPAYTFLRFTFDSPSGVAYEVRVTEIPTVLPEPSTWAMLIGGFFGAGALIRTRRHRSPRPS